MRKGAGRRGYDGDGALRFGRPLLPFADLHLRGPRLQLLEEHRVEPLTRLDVVHRGTR